MARTELFTGKLQMLDLKFWEILFKRKVRVRKANAALNCKATSCVELAEGMDMELYLTSMNEERLQLSSFTVFRKFGLPCSLLLQR